MQSSLIFISGFLEMAAALLLMTSKFRKLGAGIGFLLLLSFLPVHLQHVFDGGSQTPHFQFGPIFAWIRLIFQVIFLICLFAILKSRQGQSA